MLAPAIHSWQAHDCKFTHNLQRAETVASLVRVSRVNRNNPAEACM
jgi:hypothetical protein